MSFSFCLNKNELLLLAGFGLLYQGIELDRKGKLIQDSHRLMCSVVEILERKDAPGATEFKKVACSMISVNCHPKGAKAFDDAAASSRRPDANMPAPKTTSKSPRKQLQAIASRFASVTNPPLFKRESTWGRRSTVHDVANYKSAIFARSDSQNSVSSVVSDPTHQYNYHKVGAASLSGHTPVTETPNLDYLSFSNERVPSTDFCYSAGTNAAKDSDSDLLTGFSPTQQTEAPFNSLFPSPDVLSYISQSPSSATHDWASDTWALPPHPASAHSVISLSEEELTSGEEWSDPTCEYRGVTMPNIGNLDGLDALDANIGSCPANARS